MFLRNECGIKSVINKDCNNQKKGNVSETF